MNACIKYGLVGNIDGSVTEDSTNTAKLGSTVAASSSCRSAITTSSCFPESGWQLVSPLGVAAAMPLPALEFSSSNIISYFVARSVCDNLPAGDVKSISKSAEYLFRCGHVQSVQYASTDNCYFFKAKCLPEMRKDRVYLLKMALLKESFDISYAECGCPAGMGPHGSCKHISALAYALADLCKLQSLPEFQSCTSHLQQWNRPRGRHLDPIPVEMLGSRRRELIPSKKRDYGSMMVFDPRPSNERLSDPKALERLRCDLLGLAQPVGFLNIIIPSTEAIIHDHCYASASLSGGSSVRTGCVSIAADNEATIDAQFEEEVITRDQSDS